MFGRTTTYQQIIHLFKITIVFLAPTAEQKILYDLIVQYYLCLVVLLVFTIGK